MNGQPIARNQQERGQVLVTQRVGEVGHWC